MEVVVDESHDIKAALQEAIWESEPPPFKSRKRSRGIVICAGGMRYFTNAWIAINLLRYHGCELDIELWAVDESEIDDYMCKLVEPLGVSVRYADGVISDVGFDIEGLRWQWALKPYAIVHSDFDEVLYLDADNFPVRDPSDLFDSEAYLAEGCIFWPDIRVMAKEHPIWDVMEVPFRAEPEFETGQMLIDKNRCWEPLKLALWMNMRSDYFYQIIWGDKDTFRFAWHKFGRSFAMVPYPVQLLSLPGTQSASCTMCQNGFDGNWLFQHRNMAKWNLLGENPRVPGFLFEPECRTFLQELRSCWNGKVNYSAKAEGTSNANLSEAESAKRSLQEGVWLMEDGRPTARGCCEAETTLSDIRVPYPWPEQAWGQEIIVGEVPGLQKEDGQHLEGLRCREMTFLPDSIGRGAGRDFCWWGIKPDAGNRGLVLELEGEDIDTTSLYLTPEGSWQGWVEHTDGMSYSCRLLRLEMLYPETVEADSMNGECSSRAIHIANHAFGIGDAITGLYAVAGLVGEGISIVYHTRHAGWFGRICVPGLTITGDRPPEGTVDLNSDYPEQIRYGVDKARWYSMMAAAAVPGVKRSGIAASPFPRTRPEIDLSMDEAVLDLNNYILLSPFAAHGMRDWPESHWRRLAFLLSEAGYEVVAVGLKKDESRLKRTFVQGYAYWVLDQSPEWIIAAMLGSECVVGPDSGMIHLAGLLGVPAVCIHSHLPAEFLFSRSPTVQSLAPGTDCVFCRWQGDRGFNDGCANSCASLAAVSPEQVLEMIQCEEIAKARSELLNRVAEDTERAKNGADDNITRSLEITENRADVIAYTQRPNCGLGEAAEANIKAMRSLGLTVEQRLWERDLAIEPALRDPNQIYYHHWHPQMQDPFDLWRLHLPETGKGARHIAYWAYEIEGQLPEAFHHASQFMSEVWTPSTFCQTLFEQTGLPVHTVPHAVPSSDGLEELPSVGGRAPFTVLTLFDAWSRFGRKNPQAVIRVFQQAFPDRMDVRLVLKGRHLTGDQLQQLKADCGWDSRIKVVNRFLSESDRDKLFTSADVYLGLQRSEGFGLNLARSLGMGLPLITTGWSGLLDFCKGDNCLMVPYTLRSAKESDSGFPGDGVWAEPDERMAAKLLTKLAVMAGRNDSQLWKMRQNGRDFVRMHLGEDALRENLRARFESLGVLGNHEAVENSTHSAVA